MALELGIGSNMHCGTVSAENHYIAGLSTNLADHLSQNEVVFPSKSPTNAEGVQTVPKTSLGGFGKSRGDGRR